MTLNFSPISSVQDAVELQKTADVRSWRSAASRNAGSLSPNSVPVVIPIVSAYGEDCAIGNPRPFD
jgi:hypothetical protein